MQEQQAAVQAQEAGAPSSGEISEQRDRE